MIAFGIKQLQRTFCSSRNSPLIFGNGNSIFSVSQMWWGEGSKPFDYFVRDDLAVEIKGELRLGQNLMRVVYSACLSDSSMAININSLRKSVVLNQLIQLGAVQKEELVSNPSTVIIHPNLHLKVDEEEIQGQISKNILQLDKLFEEAVGLKISYLIEQKSLLSSEYMNEIKKKQKAISADVVASGAKLEQVIFNNGYKLQHVFLDGIIRNELCDGIFGYKFNLKNVLEALTLIDFKGKIVLPNGVRFEPALEQLSKLARELGYSRKLQFDMGTDGWHTML